jgi:hypothetical protein
MLDLLSVVPQAASFLHFFFCIRLAVNTFIHFLFSISAAIHHHEPALAIWLPRTLTIINLLTSQDNFDSSAIPQCGFLLCESLL